MNAVRSSPPQVVWFKRDLRVHDHAPLVEAAKRGPCLVLYVYEPDLLHSPEFDASHLVFINESLAELAENLSALGGQLITRHGSLPEVFEQLHRETGFHDLWSHEETGSAITFQRDLRVAAWCRERGVSWHELPQTGVVRRLKSRDGWAERWGKRMNGRQIPAPNRIEGPTSPVSSCGIMGLAELRLPPSTKIGVPRGGEREAYATLHSFLEQRGVNYRVEMSSPLTGESSCSRISPYLAWGCISMKTVHQTTQERIAHLRTLQFAGQPLDARWFGSLQSFSARLRWHCHFMQKLEDEPSIEFENMCRAYDSLREPHFNADYFAAWCEGRTGYPMVDACMRSLLATGWVNFRMRAMLVSFASYHLWLHWRPTAVFLSRHFLDFEPGIHFSQFQMQSGTTGINTVRIYSPTKQVVDQDPNGVFIRKHIAELANIPAAYIAEPHKMPGDVQRKVGCLIGRDYPSPIVDHATAYRQARERLGAVRRQSQTRQAARQVFLKHGSRKRPTQSKALANIEQGNPRDQESSPELVLSTGDTPQGTKSGRAKQRNRVTAPPESAFRQT
jgi:deoxyribodipyrimidine photo-lyase